MGTTAQKLEYLGTTKSQLKDMINYGLPSEQQITSSTTFRNYVSSIFNAFLEALRTPDTLFTNLPKKSGSGANITLNDTANAPMRITLSPSELSQSGTPTPSSPQAVHTISGSNKVVVCGKNLFNDYSSTSETFHTIVKSKVSNGIKLNGTYDKTSGGDFWLTKSNSLSYSNNMTLLKANTQYTISIQLLEGTMNVNSVQGKISSRTINNYTFAWNYKDLTFSNNKWTSTFTTGSSDIYVGAIRFVFNTSSTGEFTNAVLGIQVEENSTFTSYEPYISQEAEVDLSSKNLAYTNWAIDFVTSVGALSSTMITRKDNRNCVRWTAGAGYNDYDNKNFSLGIKFKENTQYTISYDILKENSTHSTICFKYTDGTTSTPVNVSATEIWEHQTLTSTAGKTVKYIAPYYSSGNTYIDLDTYMLNEGTTALPYVPYYTPLEYCKIGNYADKFIRTSGKNLFEMNSSITGGSGYYTYNDGTIKITSSNTGAGAYWDNKIDVQEGTYTFMLNLKSTDARPLIKPLDSSGNILTNLTISGWTYNTYYNGYYKDITTIGNNVSNISIASSVKQIQIGFVPKTVNGEFNNIYFGEQATEYEPYGSNEWYIKKNIGKVEITTFNNKSGATANNQFSTAVISNILKPSAGTITSSILSNRFTSYSPNYIYGHDIEAIGINTDGSITIGFGLSSGINTLELANTYASSNEIVAYYPLATPTYTQITGTLAEQLENVYQKLLSYTGQTNISQVNNDLGFVMSVSAIEEL